MPGGCHTPLTHAEAAARNQGSNTHRAVQNTSAFMHQLLPTAQAQRQGAATRQSHMLTLSRAATRQQCQHWWFAKNTHKLPHSLAAVTSNSHMLKLQQGSKTHAGYTREQCHARVSWNKVRVLTPNLGAANCSSHAGLQHAAAVRSVALQRPSKQQRNHQRIQLAGSSSLDGSSGAVQRIAHGLVALLHICCC
jgi:hypothetical protein